MRRPLLPAIASVIVLALLPVPAAAAQPAAEPVVARAAEPAAEPAGPKPAARPNIVFILADDWGWGDLGCYGHAQLRTPHLDRLARQGLRFTQFYVCGSVCSPSRCALMTGQFPARHAIHGHFAKPEQNESRGMPNFLDPKAPTVTRLLQQSGYVTGHFGKWHLGSGPGAPLPGEYGISEHKSTTSNDKWVDLWGPERRAHSSDIIIDETIAFVEKHREEPFYVQAWLHDTHAVLDPTPEQLAAYPRHTGALKIYYAAATNADAQIGRLLKKLDELHLAENTIVVFTSDNGPEDIVIGNASHSGVGSAGPFRGRKRSLYEGGVRVPMIVRWPAATPAGKVDNTTVWAGCDWLPTICALAGVKLPDGLALDGEDVSAALRGTPVERKTPLMWQWRFKVFGHTLNQCPMLAIREGRWKLLMNPDRSRVELYDIPADPSELNNLADRQPAVVERLAARLLPWHNSLPPGPIEPEAGKNEYRWPQ